MGKSQPLSSRNNSKSINEIFMGWNNNNDQDYESEYTHNYNSITSHISIKNNDSEEFKKEKVELIDEKEKENKKIDNEKEKKEKKDNKEPSKDKKLEDKKKNELSDKKEKKVETVSVKKEKNVAEKEDVQPPIQPSKKPVLTKSNSLKRPVTAKIVNKASNISITDYDNSPEYKKAKALYDAGDFGFPSRSTTAFDPKSLETGYQKRLEHLRVRQFVRDRDRRLNFQSVNTKVKGTRVFADSKVYFLFGKPPLAPFGVGAKTDYVEYQGEQNLLSHNIIPQVLPNAPKTQQVYEHALRKGEEVKALPLRRVGAVNVQNQRSNNIQTNKKHEMEYFVTA